MEAFFVITFYIAFVLAVVSAMAVAYHIIKYFTVWQPSKEHHILMMGISLIVFLCSVMLFILTSNLTES